MAKKTKKNISKGKAKKKREAAKARAQEEQIVVAEETSLTPEEEKKAQVKADKEAEKAKKEAEKAAAEKKRAKERKANPTFWDKTVNYFKGTWSELKKTQWLSASQLNVATGSVFGIVSIFTLITWLVDSGLGALAGLILKI